MEEGFTRGRDRIPRRRGMRRKSEGEEMRRRRRRRRSENGFAKGEEKEAK